MEYGQDGTVNTTATTGTKVGPQFKRTFPLVEDYARTFINHNVVKTGDKIFDEPRILYADAAFFKIFSFNLVKGNVTTALDAPDKIVVTDQWQENILVMKMQLEKQLHQVAGICRSRLYVKMYRKIHS
jgi:putative ABC transport system permease protein